MQLFALAYAGGTASTAYAKLQVDLPPLAEVVPLDLPGRGRNTARRPGSVDDLIDHLWEMIADRAQPDWGLLGHSYGAGLAFALAKRAEEKGQPPQVCFLSGRRAPSGRAHPSRRSMTDEELLKQVAEWGALPREFQTHPALREMAVARLREDVAFSDELHARNPEPLDQTVLHTLAGNDDPVAPPKAVHSWKRLTHAGSTAQTFDGEHFFLFTNPDVQIAIGDRLRRLASTLTQKGTP
ncbi:MULTISPECIES: thioesterase II family protein [unclassified Brevibacterium]|uniref:thioesterase II family protein n=1 Tax=unclassified Brevibacterium TaxID=2614124 RepID=UPI0008A363B9|nr:MULTISPECIES: alpha/beta fold hydrolase [unclassified Brevibacterium]OFL64976.1 gramicidin biosynthesis protein [Brevibacterium sp. HMSC063G07]OFS24510.1 gramicidin biosynthesis protein [Brevibacterium sp. HMSC07C04]